MWTEYYEPLAHPMNPAIAIFRLVLPTHCSQWSINCMTDPTDAVVKVLML